MKIKQISSKDNDKIKLLAKLKQKKYRQEYGLFKVENWKTIFECKECPEEIFITQKFIDKHSKQFEQFITKRGASKIYQIDDNCLNKISELQSSAGIVAVYKTFESKINFKNPIVYLNSINDPGNLGSILRSAVAFGYKNIVLDESCSDVYNAKVLQASKGAIFHLNIVQDNECKLLKQIKTKKIQIVGTSLRKDSKDLKNTKFNTNYCLIFGSESHGLTTEVEKIVDVFVRIKINPQMESLNVASTASIIFFKLSK